MNPSSCSIVGVPEDRRGLADEVLPELARDLLGLRRRRRAASAAPRSPAPRASPANDSSTMKTTRWPRRRSTSPMPTQLLVGPVGALGEERDRAHVGSLVRGMAAGMNTKGIDETARWFAGKGRTVGSVRPRGGAGGLRFLDVAYADGGSETYLDVPPALAWGPLLASLRARPLEGDGGRLELRAGPALKTLGGALGGRQRIPATDLSNTVIALGDALLVKAYRRPVPGPHVEIELLDALAGTGAPVPGFAGSLHWVDGERDTALALLQAFVPDAEVSLGGADRARGRRRSAATRLRRRGVARARAHDGRAAPGARRRLRAARRDAGAARPPPRRGRGGAGRRVRARPRGRGARPAGARRPRGARRLRPARGHAHPRRPARRPGPARRPRGAAAGDRLRGRPDEAARRSPAPRHAALRPRLRAAQRRPRRLGGRPAARAARPRSPGSTPRARRSWTPTPPPRRSGSTRDLLGALELAKECAELVYAQRVAPEWAYAPMASFARMLA